jgi:[acyl-carrier-protein] S-malonyltransferase
MTRHAVSFGPISKKSRGCKRMAVAFVFPGKGSQTVGMGKALAASFAPARQVFEEVDEALGSKLSVIVFDGPIETLTLTENAQPALMAVSLATMRVLEQEAGLDLKRDAQFVAGHSLGEYSALAAAGAFTLADTARLLRLRGQAMQKAVPVGVGAMAALLGLEFDAARPATTMAAARWWCRAIERRLNALWTSPRPKAPSVPCCCRYPRPSIAP